MSGWNGPRGTRMVSADATLPVALKVKELGVDGFIVKPFEPETIWAALKKI